jgi:hypothetical protein
MTYLAPRSIQRHPGRRPASALSGIWDIVTGGIPSADPGGTTLDMGVPVWDEFTDLITMDAIPASEADPADNINQTDGGGSTTSADFTNVGGVCKPKNLPTLAAARAFQGQLNRVAQVKKLGKVATDGAVGPATLALFRKVQAAAPAGSIMGDPSGCMTVAPDVDVLAAQIQAFADSLGAPATVPGPLSIAPPTILTKSGKTVVAPDAGIAGSLATLSGVEKIALLGVAGGIGYLLFTKKKRRK